MPKKILAIDYLEQRYADLSDILEVDLQQSIPESAKGYAGIVLHNGIEFDSLIKEAIKCKIPIIFHVSGHNMLREYKDRVKFTYNDYPNAHFVREGKLSSKLRAIFG